MAQPDGLYVSFDDYKVPTPVGGKLLPLGHAMTIALNPNNGQTRGSEYGRYGNAYGSAHRVPVPAFHGDPKNKEAMQAYAKKLYESYTKLHGKNKVGNKITIVYVPDTDYNNMVKDMQDVETNGLGKPYSWAKGITCGSYAHNLAVGDDPADMEFGTPSQTAPYSGWFSPNYSVSYEDKTKHRFGGTLNHRGWVPKQHY